MQKAPHIITDSPSPSNSRGTYLKLTSPLVTMKSNFEISGGKGKQTDRGRSETPQGKDPVRGDAHPSSCPLGGLPGYSGTEGTDTGRKG